MRRGKVGEPKTYRGLVYAANGAGYDRVRVCRARNGASALVDLGVGEWSEWRVETYTVDGVPVEGNLRLKLIALSPTADRFELFVPQIWPTGGDYAVPAGVA